MNAEDFRKLADAAYDTDGFDEAELEWALNAFERTCGTERERIYRALQLLEMTHANPHSEAGALLFRIQEAESGEKP
jgi:hypothetical protein